MDATSELSGKLRQWPRMMVREAKVGGYQDYFAEQQIQVMNQMIGDRLDPVFGYQATVVQGAQAASA